MPKFKTKTFKPTIKVQSMTLGTAVLTAVSVLVFKYAGLDESLGVAIATIISTFITAFLNYLIGYMTSPIKSDGVEEVPGSL